MAALAAMVGVTAFVQVLMGRPWWCEGGGRALWVSAIYSFHNSQHLFDPYTWTHVLHGLGLYAGAWWLLRDRLGQGGRFLVAGGVESAWEILENTPVIIERYRADTISLGYFGDSIANSVGDIGACALGYVVAMILPVWGSVALFVGAEVVLLAWIRDSLLLNIIMLFWPVEWIKDWQLGG